ncbi:terpenoid cyclases/Protein prenyltransferase [Tothia fuscella]|uniref:Terpenoid cyclases/Protein prenyltransferase n=1 Tax=Tothia fuscella TaxID=1048955 RepID=A0A9P4NQL6_9PEZI|nr:terpenoid cyclases/Protein prenyltransferase [Tothia fuscella]
MSAGRVEDVHPIVVEHKSHFNKPRHVKYWLRCLKTYLPQQYQSTDSNRTMLAFFTLAALDLLDSLKPNTTPEEREQYIDWVYLCQHPDGGFRGFPGSDLGEHRNEENKVWDPANVAGTYFAFCMLAILEDDFGRVNKKACLTWLRRVQRPDGSFGETVGEEGKVEGGMDPRFGYMAMGIRWFLRGRATGDVMGVPDVDADKLVECVRISQTYDGGISEAPFHEAHGGFTYCALAALSFAGHLPKPGENSSAGLSDVNHTIAWLVSRQTATLEEEDLLDTYGDETDTIATCHDAHSFVAMKGFRDTKNGKDSFDDRPTSNYHLQWVGFNGRCNKIADTCYSWWVGASLSLLDKVSLASPDPNRHYLLDKTQHIVGGFGKVAGNPPDLYHSFLGLAALSVMGLEKELKPIDATVCISTDACTHLAKLPWRVENLG